MDDALKSGRKVPAHLAPPAAFWGLRGIPERKRSALPGTFVGRGGLIFIKAPFKTFLEDFDLGDSQFFHVPLYENDQKTKRADEIYFFNLAVAKDTVILDQVDEMREVTPTLFHVELSAKKVGVRADCAEGADIWIDPKIMTLMFFSDRIVKAMKGKGFGKFAFKECDVY